MTPQPALNVRSRQPQTTQRRALLLALWLGAFVPLSAGAQDPLPSRTASQAAAEPDFLPVEQAFRVESGWLDPHRLALRFQIVPGYYLYRDRITLRWQEKGAASSRPGGTSASTAAARSTASERQVALELPVGDTKEDPYFGPQAVFHQPVEALATVKRPAGLGADAALVLTWQGCAEAGLCYPPQHRILNLPE